MKEEPFFLINDFLVKQRDELENVLKAVHPVSSKEIQKSIFIKNFTNELFKAYVNHKPKAQLAEHNSNLEKEDLVKRREELLRLLQSKTAVKEKKEVILSKETGISLVNRKIINNQYIVEEPKINEIDKKVLDELKQKVTKEKDSLKNNLIEIYKNYNIEFTQEFYDKIRYYFIRDNEKYGMLSPLIEDNDVNEIVCESAENPISVNYKGQYDMKTNLKFESEKELKEIIQFLATKANQKVSAETPFLNVNFNNFSLSANYGNEFIKPKFVIIKN
jgi:hypothetical protein